MTWTSNVTCDYCTEKAEFEQEDNPIEMGWLEVAKYDMMSEEVRHYDFCSDECLVSHFG